MGIHDGHRQRIKNRFRSEGLDNFEDIHVLELLLCYCIPRIDTNPLAHALLTHFGSLTQVLEASREELEQVPGVGESVSTFLTLTNAVCRYYLVKRSALARVLKNTAEYSAFLMPYFHGRRNEIVFLLALDAKCKVICCREVTDGSINSASISVRRVVEMALGCNATTVILAHNHPGGLALPSGDDVVTTYRIARALWAVDIRLADHLIVSDDDSVSLAQSGRYNPAEIFSDMD